MSLSKKRQKELEELETEDTKCCLECKKVKPLFEFSIRSNGHKFAAPYCFDCEKERAKRRSIQKYGITLKEYDKILEKQNGKCKICRTEKVGYKNRGRFCVDHDHKTNKIRGLLCVSCNLALGHAKDNIRILAAMIQHLIDSRK